MTRKSNRVKARRSRTTRSLAEILEEESNQGLRQLPLPRLRRPHLPPVSHPQQQHVQQQNQQQNRNRTRRRRNLAHMKEINDKIYQCLENMIRQHDLDVRELEQHRNVPAQVVEASSSSLQHIRQFSHRRHFRDGQVILTCQDFLQQLVDMVRRIEEEQEREERVLLRQMVHQLQIQLSLLLDFIQLLNQQFYRKLQDYSDHIMHRVLQYASAMNQENPEWGRSILENPDVIAAMARYSKQVGQVYRSSHGRVVAVSTLTVSNTEECMDSIIKEMDCCQNNEKHIQSIAAANLVVNFGDEEMVPIEEKDASCIICLIEYQNGDDICRNAAKEILSSADAMHCNHFFHKGCITQWLQTTSCHYHRRTTCPWCRNYFSIHDDTAV